MANNLKKLPLHPLAKLACIWLILSGSVLATSFYYPWGRISSDSTVYLELAANLRAGQGLTSADPWSPSGRSFIIKRPVGYPLLIAAANWLFRLDVFWSAKIVNICSAAVFLFLTYRLFGHSSWVFGLVLLTASPLNIFSMTWSEVPFITAMLAAAALLWRFNLHPSWWGAFGIFLSALSLWLLRYAGIFFLAVLLIQFAWYLFRRHFGPSLKIFTATSAAIIFIMVNLIFNFILSGGLIGEHDFAASRPWPLIIKNNLQYLLGELNPLLDFTNPPAIIFGLCLASAFLFLSSAWTPSHPIFRSLKQNRLGFYFLLAALVHLALIIAWTIKIGNAAWRLVIPSTILILLTAVHLYWETYPSYRRLIASLLLLIAALSWLINVPGKIYWHHFHTNQPTYAAEANRLISLYSTVPPGSVVAFGDLRLRYLRPDLKLVYLLPEELLLSPQEFQWLPDKWPTLLNRLCRAGYEAILVDSAYLPPAAAGDPALSRLQASNPGRGLLKVAACPASFALADF